MSDGDQQIEGGPKRETPIMYRPISSGGQELPKRQGVLNQPGDYSKQKPRPSSETPVVEVDLLPDDDTDDLYQPSGRDRRFSEDMKAKKNRGEEDR